MIPNVCNTEPKWKCLCIVKQSAYHWLLMMLVTLLATLHRGFSFAASKYQGRGYYVKHELLHQGEDPGILKGGSSGISLKKGGGGGNHLLGTSIGYTPKARWLSDLFNQVPKAQGE